jgi:hypothetical protein
VFFLEVEEDGTRVIAEAAVAGLAAGKAVLGSGSSDAALGSPLLDEYGDVVAVLGGGTFLPGATALDRHALMSGSVRLVGGHGRRALKLPPLPDTAAATRTLAQLAETGVFVLPIGRNDHHVTGVLGTGIEQQNGIPMAVGQKFRFTRSDGRCVVFITWIPTASADAQVAFRLFDEDNRQLGATDPKKMKLRANRPFVQYWELDVSQAVPGVYRVDLVLDGTVIWRTFYRVD